MTTSDKLSILVTYVGAWLLGALMGFVAGRATPVGHDPQGTTLVGSTPEGVRVYRLNGPAAPTVPQFVVVYNGRAEAFR